MEHPNIAIILAAGMGLRLKPLTDDLPKCLTEVNGKTILENALENLENAGFEETVIVIGFLGEKIRRFVGKRFGNMNITYVVSEKYSETNNMYSLWLARDYMMRGALLIEGDIFFDFDILERISESDAEKSYWVADIFTEEMNGCLLSVDQTKRIVQIQIVRHKLPEYKPTFFKSVGMVKMSPEYGTLFAKWLDEDVQAGNVNIYYDLVLAQHTNDYPLYICDVHGLRWAEIDDANDLEIAEKIFAHSLTLVN